MADAPVVGVAAVAGRDVEHAVLAEADPVAVVVELRPVDRGDDLAGLGIGGVRIFGRDFVLGDDVGVVPPELLGQIALEIEMRGVGDVKAAVLPEAGMEGEAEQPALVEVLPELRDQVPDVEEGLRLKLAVPDDAHAPELLDHEGPVVALRLDHRQRRVEPRDEGLELDRHVRPGGRARGEQPGQSRSHGKSPCRAHSCDPPLE